MGNIQNIIDKLEFAQVGWVVADIGAATNFFENSLGVQFPKPAQVSAKELNMSYKGSIVDGEWLTTQTYNGGSFIELVQPLSGQSMFHDYLAMHPAGGTQHLAFRLPVKDLDEVIKSLHDQGYVIISEVDHPIAHMVFFDTYQTLGVAIEIMGVTPGGWDAIKQMQKK